MTMYQPGIPTGTVNLDVDYQNIQDNFQQLDTTYGTDHVAYSQGLNNGYHNIIHLVPNATPTPSTGIGQLFDNTVYDGINTDQILYFLTGENRLLQLTRNFVPSVTAKGYTFLPGGLIMEWGSFSATNISSMNVSFPQIFPNAIYNVQVTYVVSDNSTIRSGIESGTVSKNGFTWIGTSTSSLITVYWTAIGN
jgi:hypothetical protein